MSVTSRSASSTSRPPNVVVVLADDLGWGDLGCYGATKIPTPNIDQLAGEGVRLTDCHSSSAVCTPSRYSLMTGRYSWRGPLKHKVLLGHGPPIIEPSRPTVASVLRSSGYATAAVGKWHLGLGWRWHDGSVRDAFSHRADVHLDPVSDAGFGVDYTKPFTGGPTELGFQRFFGIAASLDMPPYCFLDQDRAAALPVEEKQRYITTQRRGLQSPGWQDDQADVTFVREAQRWLRKEGANGQSVFLYLSLSAPHRPCVPPDFLRGRSSAGPRGDSVCLVDWAVGEVRATLEELGALDDTLLIVTSDNGGRLRTGRRDFDDGDIVEHRPNGPWRGQKADIWEGGHRVPFVARLPGVIPAGAVRHDTVCLTDMMPTIANATGTSLPDGAAEDGISVWSALTGGAALRRPTPVVHHSAEGAFALRHDAWKVAFTSGSGGFSAPKGLPSSARWPHGQLYDVAADPDEQQNLWSDRPDVVAELYAELKRVVRDSGHGLAFDVPLDLDATPAG